MRIPPVCQIIDPNDYECIDPYTGQKIDAVSDCDCAYKCGALRQKYKIYYQTYQIRGLLDDIKQWLGTDTGKTVLVVGGAVLAGVILLSMMR